MTSPITTPVKTKMTSEEYRQLPESDVRMELIDGEIIVDGEIIAYGDMSMSPSPVDIHQFVASITHLYLGIKLGAWWLRYESDLHLEEGVVLRPDLFWVHPQSTTCHLVKNYWHGAPDLVIEILSPSTAKLDRGVKYQLYERHGVREYWLIDPTERVLEVYRLKDGQYVRLGFYEPGATFTSPVLALPIEVALLIDGVDGGVLPPLPTGG